MYRLLAATAAVVWIGIWSSGCSRTRDVEGSEEVRQAAARGEEVFFTHCAVCHSADTEGAIVGPSLKSFFSGSRAPLADGTVLPQTDAAVRRIIEDGTTNMPPLAGHLTDQQISDVIAYMHTL
jgi:mono/diheme cytochrome c family protein